MRNRIASIVTGSLWGSLFTSLLGACAYSPDANLLSGGVVDAQSLTGKTRCPRGATIVHGQTMGVQSALWCEKPGGIKHGPFVEWYENHQKKTAGEYIEGLRNGPWAFFLPNGQLDTRITYDNGAAVSTETGAPQPSTASPAPPAPAPPASQTPRQ
jgi:hypothetical protein